MGDQIHDSALIYSPCLQLIVRKHNVALYYLDCLVNYLFYCEWNKFFSSLQQNLKISKRVDEQKKKLSQSETQPTVKSMFAAPSGLLPSNSPRVKNLNEAVAYFVCKDSQPFTAVEGVGFRHLMNQAEPRYQVPSATTISRTVLPTVYDSVRRRLKSEVDKAKYISLTSDIWRSRAKDEYISLTAHFVTEDFELKHPCLGVFEFDESHTGDAIRKEMDKIIADWAITPTSITAIVTDNARNYGLAGQKGAWPHKKCAAHTLQLCIKNSIRAVPEISNVLTHVRQVVSHFSRSMPAERALHAAQSRRDMPQRNLLMDIDIRWNYTLFMLQSLVNSKEAVNDALINLKSAPAVLTQEEWSIITDLTNFLTPLEEASREFEAEKHVTASLALPILHSLFSEFPETSSAAFETPCQIFKHKMATALRERFSQVLSDELYQVATLLDPRYKAMLLKDKGFDEASALLLKFVKAFGSEKGGCSAVPAASSSQEPPSKKSRLWQKFDEKFPEQSRPKTDTPDEEINTYLLEAGQRRADDVLAYWNLKQSSFGSLSQLARKVLGVPLSSAPSERDFSVASNIITSRREKLQTKTVEMLVFLKENWSL